MGGGIEIAEKEDAACHRMLSQEFYMALIFDTE